MMVRGALSRESKLTFLLQTMVIMMMIMIMIVITIMIMIMKIITMIC